MEVYLLKNGISLNDIREMNDTEIDEYIAVLQVMTEKEQEAMRK